MDNLAKLQNLLLSDIFSPSASENFDSKGLKIYRNNLRATATKALSITFPTVYQLLGEDAFALVTGKLLQFAPPQHGDWSLWGEQLPELLSSLLELSEYPFLADCAQLDYHCHQMVRQPLAKMEFASLTLMQSHQPEELMIALNPSLLLMQSDFPVAAIRRAHQQGGDPAKDLQQALASQSDTHYLACYPDNSQVRVANLTAVEFAWLNALKTKSLGEALTAFNNTEFSFETWLTAAIPTHLIHQVIVRHTARSKI